MYEGGCYWLPRDFGRGVTLWWPEYPVWAVRDGYIPVYTVGMVNTRYIPVFMEYSDPSTVSRLRVEPPRAAPVPPQHALGDAARMLRCPYYSLLARATAGWGAVVGLGVRGRRARARAAAAHARLAQVAPVPGDGRGVGVGVVVADGDAVLVWGAGLPTHVVVVLRRARVVLDDLPEHEGEIVAAVHEVDVAHGDDVVEEEHGRARELDGLEAVGDVVVVEVYTGVVVVVAVVVAGDVVVVVRVGHGREVLADVDGVEGPVAMISLVSSAVMDCATKLVKERGAAD